MRRCFISGLSGPIENSPNIWVVTPCLSSLMERPSTIRDASEWDSMLMKPGATARPLASMIVVAVAALRSPIAAMRSPVIIRGCDVYDGAGGPPVHADVGITGDRIAAIGDLKAATATTIIDAKGLA